jgi:predicted NBD/HSP70 family sugar kinase
MTPTGRVGPDKSGTGTNQENVRRHNLGTLLHHVHRAGQISRAELTTRMALNRSTIAALVAELESLGVIEQTMPSSGSRTGAGRPSADVLPCPDGPFVVAVDVGVDRVVAARVGLGGAVQRRALAPIVGEPSVGATQETALRLIEEVVDSVASTSPLVGIGIGVPGLVRRSDGMVRIAPNLGWRDVPFASVLSADLGLGVPVSIGNDADLGALAEHQRGAGIGLTDLIYICGNIGVGAGVIAGGMPMPGSGGYAGEVGHLPYSAEGKSCHCGNRGCWETEVGAITIATAIGWPLDQVLSLAEELGGYTAAPPELREIGGHLGRGLALIVNLMNPQTIVLGGYLAALFPLVQDEVLAALHARALRASSESVTLCLPGLGRDSVLHGAAEIAFDNLFTDPVASLAEAKHDVSAVLSQRVS